jgi:hypothetical protein
MKLKADEDVAHTALGRSTDSMMAVMDCSHSRRMVMIAPSEKGHSEDTDGGDGVGMKHGR